MESSHREDAGDDGAENSDDKEPLQGIDFFPERRGDKIERSWFRMLFFGENRDNLQRVKCERHINNIVGESMNINFILFILTSVI